MLQQDNISFNPRYSPNPNLKTGFQEKYIDPVLRKLFLDRQTPIFLERSPPQKYTSGEVSKEDDLEKLNHMVEQCQHPLFKIITVFPFVIFPNEVIIDINKVTIIFRNFFASAQTHSVLIKDISDVVVETNPIFAVLKIVDIGYTDNTIDVNYLKRSDAERARKVIQGLVMVHRHGIDLSKVFCDDLLEKVENLGSIGNLF